MGRLPRPADTDSSVNEIRTSIPVSTPTVSSAPLHRHVAVWRAGVILTFDEQWLAEDTRVGQSLPRALRASAASHLQLPTAEHSA
jgi:hypothetical protein